MANENRQCKDINTMNKTLHKQLHDKSVKLIHLIHILKAEKPTLVSTHWEI